MDDTFVVTDGNVGQNIKRDNFNQLNEKVTFTIEHESHRKRCTKIKVFIN